eukprot:1376924-Prorocentrum_lima.AAC.1
MDQPEGHFRRRLNFYWDDADGQPDQDYIGIEEETPLTALKAQCQATGADIVASLQDVDDPSVLRT